MSRSTGSFAAVPEVSLSISRGSLVALLGPSGGGKTTTLRMVAGLSFFWPQLVLARMSLNRTAVAATVAVLLANPVALFLFRSRSRFRGGLAVAAVAPLLVFGVARVIGWLAILGDGGLLNSALAGLGLPKQALINNWTGVQIGLTESVMPYAVLALLAALVLVLIGMALAIVLLMDRLVGFTRIVGRG